MLSTVSNLFPARRNKNRVILGNCLCKGNQVSFELFLFSTSRHLELAGTKLMCKFFDRSSHDQQKGNGTKETCDAEKKVQWKLGET